MSMYLVALERTETTYWPVSAVDEDDAINTAVQRATKSFGNPQHSDISHWKVVGMGKVEAFHND